MDGYIFFSVFLILLLTLYEKIEIRYFYDGKFALCLTFSVIEINLWNFKKKKRKKSALKRRLCRFYSIRSGYSHVLSHSAINVDRIYLNRQSDDSPLGTISRFGSYPILISLALAYLKQHALIVTENENAISIVSDSDAERCTYFSITQTVRVFHLLSGLLISSISYFKNIAKEG